MRLPSVIEKAVWCVPPHVCGYPGPPAADGFATPTCCDEVVQEGSPRRSHCGRHPACDDLPGGPPVAWEWINGHVWPVMGRYMGRPTWAPLCLEHDNDAYRALVALGVAGWCIAEATCHMELGEAREAAESWPPDQLSWAEDSPYAEVRLAAAERMPPDQLDWAACDSNFRVRAVAARRWPVVPEWAERDANPHARSGGRARRREQGGVGSPVALGTRWTWHDSTPPGPRT